MNGWQAILNTCERLQEPAVLVSIVETKGSTPRERHAHMLVTASRLVGTIGGGQLEYRAVARARLILDDDGTPDQILRLPLGPEIGQCCGGHASLLLNRLDESSNQWLTEMSQAIAQKRDAWLQTQFDQGRTKRRLLLQYPVAARPGDLELDLVEPVQTDTFELYLFGAGHVGRAIATVMSGLPGRISWIDSRADEFPVIENSNITCHVTGDPVALVQTAPAGAFYLVMTHSHQTDFELCEQILRRQDFCYAGLIGSATKRARFEKRFELRNINPSIISRLTCPIGLGGISGKTPGEIAVSVSAQILQIIEQRKNMVADNPQAHKLNCKIM